MWNLVTTNLQNRNKTTIEKLIAMYWDSHMNVADVYLINEIPLLLPLIVISRCIIKKIAQKWG